jgi:hypothetical protein
LGDLNVSKIATRGLGCTQTGTPYYASPEVWKDNPYNLKSDIWSLGCLCYEILMLKTPFRAETMEGLYRKVMKGKYPEISKKYSNKFDFVISHMLQLKPEERPTTGDILKIPEIVEKIEELKIFPLNANNNNQSVVGVKSRNNSVMNINNSFQSLSPYNNAPTSINMSTNLMAKNMSGNSIEQSNNDTENNASRSYINQLYDSISNNNNEFLNPRTPKKVNKSEIIDILNNNLNYFNQKKIEEKNKYVLNTIRLPNTLGKLNDKLPASQYESDSIKQKKNFIGLSFPNKALPMLKVRYNSEKENIKENNIYKYKKKNDRTIELNPPTILKDNRSHKNKEKKNIIEGNILLNKEKNNNSQILNRYHKLSNFNTLKMMIDKKKPFNYKGEIDIIVEE